MLFPSCRYSIVGYAAADFIETRLFAHYENRSLLIFELESRISGAAICMCTSLRHILSLVALVISLKCIMHTPSAIIRAFTHYENLSLLIFELESSICRDM